MRKLSYTNQFARDFKREHKGRYKKVLDELLLEVLTYLRQDAPLPKSYIDHPLSGDLKDCRDCHLKPDLVLIYRKPNPTDLELVRIGSHSQLDL